MRILLIGPQGSGKSTQADLIAQKLNLPEITLGDIFRQITSQTTEEGKRIKQILDSGQLVDDQTAADLIRNRLNEEDIKAGFVMDGYPRTLEQANIYDPNIDKVIYLNVPREEVVKRLMQRGRADDTLELINKRLDSYYQQTEPLLDYYKQKGILIEIDGVGDVNAIEQRIKEAVDGKK